LTGPYSVSADRSVDSVAILEPTTDISTFWASLCMPVASTPYSRFTEETFSAGMGVVVVVRFLRNNHLSAAPASRQSMTTAAIAQPTTMPVENGEDINDEFVSNEVELDVVANAFVGVRAAVDCNAIADTDIEEFVFDDGETIVGNAEVGTLSIVTLLVVVGAVTDVKPFVVVIDVIAAVETDMHNNPNFELHAFESLPPPAHSPGTVLDVLPNLPSLAELFDQLSHKSVLIGLPPLNVPVHTRSPMATPNWSSSKPTTVLLNAATNMPNVDTLSLFELMMHWFTLPTRFNALVLESASQATNL